jgi:hypothetical protein
MRYYSDAWHAVYLLFYTELLLIDIRLSRSSGNQERIR